MRPEQLEKLRLLTLGDKQDSSQDELLQLLAELATARFGLYLSYVRKKRGVAVSTEIPDVLSWILTEVIAKRFNRIGSEGLKSESVEGHRLEFEESDFEAYAELIDGYFQEPGYGCRRRGEVHCY